MRHPIWWGRQCAVRRARRRASTVNVGGAGELIGWLGNSLALLADEYLWSAQIAVWWIDRVQPLAYSADSDTTCWRLLVAANRSQSEYERLVLNRFSSVFTHRRDGRFGRRCIDNAPTMHRWSRHSCDASRSMPHTPLAATCEWCMQDSVANLRAIKNRSRLDAATVILERARERERARQAQERVDRRSRSAF